MKVERQLKEGDLDALRLLIGEMVNTLYAEGIDVSPASSVAPYLVHRLSGAHLGRFVVIESDWSDTPDEAIDYHEMTVSVETRPRNVPWRLESEDRPGGTIHWPYSTFNVIPRVVVAAISVWQRAESGNTDTVIYDAGIVLHGDDGRETAIFAHQSIAGGVEVTTDPIAIAELTNGCSVRIRFP